MSRLPSIEQEDSGFTGAVSIAVASQVSFNVIALGVAANQWLAPVQSAIWAVVVLASSILAWMATRDVADKMQARRVEQRDRFFALLRNDALTGTLNRSFFLDKIRTESEPGALLVIDVDHFKAVNDRFGHYTGDAALAHLASCMQKAMNDAGYVGRLGGEEFAVFLPQLNLAAGLVAAEQLRAAIEDNEFEFDGNLQSLTVSIGVAEHQPEAPIGRTLRTADDNLYAAKKAGRNRVAAHANVVILLQEHLDLNQQQIMAG